MAPSHSSEGVAGKKQHHDGDGIGDAQGWPGVAHENERNHHRERAEEHQQKNTDGAQPIVLAQPRSFWRLGQLLQPLVHRFEFGWFQDACDYRRQRVCYEAVCFLWIGGLAYGAKREQPPPLFRQAAHQIQHSVDDSPSEIASQRTNEHRAHLTPPGLGHTERAGEREDHDQAEEDFGDAVNRFQHALRGSFGRISQHAL